MTVGCCRCCCRHLSSRSLEKTRCQLKRVVAAEASEGGGGEVQCMPSLEIRGDNLRSSWLNVQPEDIVLLCTTVSLPDLQLLQ